MSELEKHGRLRRHRVDWYEYWSWKCNYCEKTIVGSYLEVLTNAKRHLKKHGVEE